MIELLRIDDKLIHSQIIWGWVQSLKASCIIVANDEAAHDEVRRNLLIMAAQSAGTDAQTLTVEILSLEEAVKVLKLLKTCRERSLLVVSKPADVVFLIERGVPIENVSVGWMSFLPGKKRILKTVSVDEKDIKAFRKLISKGVSVKYQASPSDVEMDIAGLIR